MNFRSAAILAAAALETRGLPNCKQSPRIMMTAAAMAALRFRCGDAALRGGRRPRLELVDVKKEKTIGTFLRVVPQDSFGRMPFTLITDLTYSPEFVST